MKKLYNLPQDCIDIILEVKEKKGFSSETEALKDIIKSKRLADELASLLYDKLKNDILGIRLASRTAERNSLIIKDILNTMIANWSNESVGILLPCDNEDYQTTQMKQAEELMKQRLAKWKQISDNARIEE